MLDPADNNIILSVIDQRKKQFDKTKIDEASDAWKSFRDIIRIDITRDQRRNILVNVKAENGETIYENMKKSIRLLKGSLVENHVETKKNV